VLLYLKKSGLDKQGKAPIMGRITLNRSIVRLPEQELNGTVLLQTVL